MASAPSDPAEADDNALITALRDMPASGSGSFENLVRDLLSRETGQRFTLAKSGPQGGVDARTSSDEFSNVIGVETKRYGAQTPLPADETRSKLDDAATTHPDLELWILVASREVKEPDASDLHAKGNTLGIEVLILDWPDSAELLPALLILCSRHEDILPAYVAITSEIEGVLRDARAHPTYADQCTALRQKLVQPVLGYGNAREAIAQHLRSHMASMPAASARIGRYTNLTDPSVIRIDRAGLREAIAAWWSAAEPRPPLALLGAEGMGKTWAALSWWLDRELAGTHLPLTLIVPARFIASATPADVIGGALYQIFGVRNAMWWARRARRWCASAQATRIVLIIDGLNERFDAADWSILATELRLDAWAGAVDLVMTDRADHWRRLSGGFQAAGIACTEISVGAFDDTELDQILGRAGMDRATLDPTLLPLMRVPRLCTLALRHWARLSGSGDVTPERLVYEDFRDRIYPNLDDQEMRNLIATIGGTLRTANQPDVTVLRREVAEALAAESGAQNSEATISAIVSGVWFAPVPGEPHRFRVNPDLAPIAMGLALVRAVQSIDTEAEVVHRIEAFVDDLRGLQLGVTLIGIAASFATIAPECGVVARRVLLDTWLGSDNFYGNELKRYTRLIAEDPDYFLDRTERVWRDRQRVHDDRNVHLAGIANAAEAYPAVMDQLVSRATLWLSETFAWRDLVNGTAAPIEVAGPAVADRLHAWNAARDGLPPLILIEPDDDYLSVADTLLSAISYLPRAPFAEALGNYAIVTELTHEMHYRRDRFEWLLRANREDAAAAEQAIVAQAVRIRAVGDPNAVGAADLLLDALASLDPAARPQSERLTRRFGRPSSICEDAAGILQWNHTPEEREPGWGEVTLRYSTDLASRAVDHTARLSDAAVTLLRDAAEDMLVCDADRDFEMTAEVRVVLARWAPDLLVRFLGRTTGIDTGRHNLNRIVTGLGASWLAHDDGTRLGIEAAFRASLRLPVARGNDRGPTLNANLAVLALAEASGPSQFAAFREMLGGPTWPKSMVDLLKPLAAEEYAALEEILVPTAETRILTGWLGLLAHSDLTEMPAGYPPVAALLRHENADVRTAAMHVAQNAPDNALCNILRDSGWTVSGLSGDEAVYGSTALARANPIPGDTRPTDIIPLALGYLARQWPDETRYVQAFADHVRSRVDRELNPPRATQGFGHAIDDRRSYDRLVADDPEGVEAWIAPATSGVRLDLGHMLFSADKAIIELCRALLRAGRPSGAAVWRALIAGMAETNVKSDDLRIMVFELPLNEVTALVRREALDALNFDYQLYEAASALRRQDDSAGLIALINEMLGRSTYDQARALVLAGELDNDDTADALWRDRILPTALPRWLSDVRATALRRYRTNIQAKHWMAAFIDSTNPIRQFGAFELFIYTAGRTCARWATRMMDEARPRVSPRAYDQWRINVPIINARLKDDGKAAKDTLAFTQVPKYDQSPWS